MTPNSSQPIVNIKSMSILQLNCHHSPAVFHSLFNDPKNTFRHILMLQEPAVYPHSGTPMSNPNWVIYLPSIPPPLDPDAPTSVPRYRCATYVNKRIQTHLITQLNSHLSLVVTIKIKPSPTSNPINLINAYLPPACTSISQTLSPSLTQTTSGPVLVGTDSNLHHPTWNPPSYHHSHPAAEDLILLAASHHLTLRLELGVPTFYASSNRITNTTIDLIWTNEEAYDLATSCITDTSFEHSHSSYHAAILTVLDLPKHNSITMSAPRLNWKKSDDGALSLSLHSFPIQALIR